MTNNNNNNKNTTPIGVFDSGMGGLTVLAALKKALPNESFIYLGDTARLPYGTKSPDTVRQYAVQMAKILIERKVKAMVIACNTATTAALSYLQSILPDIPVLGVIAPGADAAILATKNNRIAVLATETTILSKAYQNQIISQIPNAIISAKACSLLVALAEEGMTNNHVAKAILEHYLEAFSDEDTILLGCTHFPVFKTLLKTLVPENIKIVDSAKTTADALSKLLDEANLLNEDTLPFIPAYEVAKPQIKYLVTDSISRFQTIGEIFLGEPLVKENIELVDATPGS